jgi:hypothetical protein
MVNPHLCTSFTVPRGSSHKSVYADCADAGQAVEVGTVKVDADTLTAGTLTAGTLLSIP